MFTIGLPREQLQSIALMVNRAANRLNLKLQFMSKPRSDPEDLVHYYLSIKTTSS